MKLLPSLLAASIAFGLTTPAFAAQSDKKVDAEIYKNIKLRNIGPAVTGGRVSDFAFNPNNPAQYYVATAAGGIWKTDNAGTTWKPIFDNETSFSLGDITMDPNNTQVIWAGSGENNSQRSVAYGDGVYKSEDGGNSWNNVGLKTQNTLVKF